MFLTVLVFSILKICPSHSNLRTCFHSRICINRKSRNNVNFWVVSHWSCLVLYFYCIEFQGYSRTVLMYFISMIVSYSMKVTSSLGLSIKNLLWIMTWPFPRVCPIHYNFRFLFYGFTFVLSHWSSLKITAGSAFWE